MTSPNIPISRVELGPDVEALVLEVLRSGHLVQGPMVERLERQFSSLTGVRHAVAVTNGTIALVAAIQAAGVVPGDEVVTSPFTFVAHSTPRWRRGPRSLRRHRPRRFRARSRRGRRGRDVGDNGRRAGASLRASRKLCRIRTTRSAARLALIEDAAQAHGARFGDRAGGSFGTGCFSLYATKNVTTGEGGVVTTDDDNLADRLRVLRNQGRRAVYEYEMAGHNYRMTDLQAAVGIPQMDRLDAVTTVARPMPRISVRRSPESTASCCRLSATAAGMRGISTPFA